MLVHRNITFVGANCICPPMIQVHLVLNQDFNWRVLVFVLNLRVICRDAMLRDFSPIVNIS